MSFSFKSALSLTAFLKVASDSFMTVNEEKLTTRVPVCNAFLTPESSLHDQAKSRLLSPKEKPIE
ncbi:MAG: hypothetical protein MK293_01065 [Pedosphaera sp.]|nr:hypothetical protein [Pedosphaera sp.]